ncbi:hypothetical protein AX016_3264 [Cellulophaga sp. RHA19]|uniref:DUF6588 family protein n=1 Tax=Cellulophaga sp. RHA19 TaxID=1798237 RepID=UPI000C2B75F2|nr:DUF6588 family protein [Cellulophaga sp. RHA19]PKB45029.1 hypothetical protein AX016_3264 [Cellulophaga sp. RHA19]
MKKFSLVIFLALSAYTSAQSSANEVFAAGVDDANKFINDYLSPVSEGMLYSISGGWYNTADAKPLGGFEISIIGNMAQSPSDKKSFILNTEDYENLQFVDGSISKEVSSGLGDIEGINVFVEDENGLFREEFELPSGLASENINFVPSAFIQASVGLIKGTEIKARFLPKIKTDDVEVGMFGVGLQHDFTKLLPADKILPVAISGVIGYTHLTGMYDFTDQDVIAGENQRLDMKMNTWVFQAVVSTKMPIINFYGGLGYLTGKSTVDVLGTYRVQSGPFIGDTYTDPFSIKSDASGVTGNIGAKLKLGFFRIHADYSMAKYNNLSFGVNFGFR